MICVDEMGPITVKTYPGEAWEVCPNRATFEPDYGRRGKLWVHGALEPATGKAITILSPDGDSVCHVQLLEKIMTALPAARRALVDHRG